MALVVGIDIGTQSLKAVVCGDDLAVLGEGHRGYATEYPRPGWAEQDPALWEAALAPSIASALAQAGRGADEIAGIGVAGQLDGCVAVDARGRALAPCLIWQDRRAVDELPVADVLARTGQVVDACHMAPKIRWLAVRHRAARYHQPTTYLVERLTGIAAIDPGLASTTLLYDLATAAWSPELLAAFAIDPGVLPEVRPAHAIAGALDATGAALTGLPAGIPVAVGSGDDFATPLGAGLVAPGRVACVVGTAEVVGALHAVPVIDTGGLVETHAYPAGGYFIENPGWMSGGALTWLGGVIDEPDPAAIDALAATAPPGADGLLFLPALAGAMTPRWHAGARAAFYGLTPGHGRAHVARAVLEAMALAERDVIERLVAIGVAADSVLMLGGGRRSTIWNRIRADATGLPHAPAGRGDTCAIAAAMLAAVAAGALPDVATAAGLAPPPGEPVTPRPEARAVYDEAHARSHALFSALQPMFT